MHKLSVAEANDLMTGFFEKEKREARLQYNAHRFTSAIVYKTLTGKDLDITFDWEDKAEDEDTVSTDEADEIRRYLQELNEKNDTLDHTIQEP